MKIAKIRKRQNSLIRLLRFVWPRNRFRLSVLGISTLVCAFSPVFVVSLTSVAVGIVAMAFEGNASPGSAMKWGAVLVVAATVGPVLSLVSNHLIGRIQLDAMRQLRDNLTGKCTMLSMAQMESPIVRNSQKLASEVVEADIGLALSNAVGLLVGALSLLSLSGLLLVWNPIVAVLVVVAPLPAILGSIFYGRVGWKIEVNRADKMRLAQHTVDLSMTNRCLPELRLLGADFHLLRAFRRHLDEFLREDTVVLRRQSRAMVMLTLLAAAITASAYLLAIRHSLNSGGVGDFAGFIIGASAVQSACQQVLAAGSGLYLRRLRLSALFSFLDIDEGRGIVKLSGDRDRIATAEPPSLEFDDVWFTYPGADEPVLCGVSFVIHSGEAVGLVGENGSGKSTLMKLVLGVYQPDRGQILMNGRELKSFENQLVSDYCSAVFQEPVRFVGSVRDNISGLEEISSDDDKRVWLILESLGLTDMVLSLDIGLDTLLGREFGGHEFSVGEWQRVALARALFQRKRLLILDEPTSASDYTAALALEDILNSQRSKMTILLISHDNDTIMKTDRIVVLGDGRVLEGSTSKWRTLIERHAITNER
ncbi:MAG: ABC transporter ATP-binding protein/permease [Propionibacteriaceae bacterium]|jgi:ATP-binding cassette subfamily B protein|nr:ABC transporter ATP-binding protein/permease [Propionibacteriaceae bacterium]